jgi:hypothetical protein
MCNVKSDDWRKCDILITFLLLRSTHASLFQDIEVHDAQSINNLACSYTKITHNNNSKNTKINYKLEKKAFVMKRRKF